MWGAIAGGVASAVGSIGGSLLSSSAAKNASGQSEYASRHRYRWAVEDMRAAGLNPILAATSGGIAGATAPNYQTGDYRGLEGAGHSASTVFNSISQRKQIESNIQLQDAQTANQLADVPVKQEAALNYRAQNSNIQSQNELLKQQSISEASRRVLMEAQARQASASAGYYGQQRVSTELQNVRRRIEADFYRNNPGDVANEINFQQGLTSPRTWSKLWDSPQVQEKLHSAADSYKRFDKAANEWKREYLDSRFSR